MPLLAHREQPGLLQRRRVARDVRLALAQQLGELADPRAPPRRRAPEGAGGRAPRAAGRAPSGATERWAGGATSRAPRLHAEMRMNASHAEVALNLLRSESRPVASEGAMAKDETMLGRGRIGTRGMLGGAVLACVLGAVSVGWVVCCPVRRLRSAPTPERPTAPRATWGLAAG